MPDEIVLDQGDERALEAAWRRLHAHPSRATPLPRHPGEPSPPDDDDEEEPRQHMRVPEGTPGAEEKRDSLGRRYFDLPGTEPPGEPEQAPAQTTPHPPPAPPLGSVKPQSGESPPPSASTNQPATLKPGDAASSQRRKNLAQSPIRAARSLGGGVNETRLLELEDGSMGVFKPSDGEEPDLRRGVKVGTYWRREVAASEVAELLGFGDLVPTTTVRKIQHPETPGVRRWLGKSTPPTSAREEVGSVQQFVPGTRVAAEVPYGERFDGDEDAVRAAVFDYLIGHLDRHSKNWLLRDGKLVLIDNGLSFPDRYEPIDFFNMRFWGNAKEVDMPDLTPLADRWPEVEDCLQRNGIEENAIALTKQRFVALTGKRHRVFDELPSLLPGYQYIDQMTDAHEKYR